jgi:hypothetical protein
VKTDPIVIRIERRIISKKHAERNTKDIEITVRAGHLTALKSQHQRFIRKSSVISYILFMVSFFIPKGIYKL